jgi:5-bromo-4-chloroindolyl phosphate hydrolysis protein
MNQLTYILLAFTGESGLNFWQTLAIASIPAVIASLVTYFRNLVDIQKYKADSMAERTAKHFLKHKGYTDRSFKTIKKHLGGWDKDEDGLRKILVRAGAVRVFREEGDEKEEWWYLLSRDKERIEKLKTKTTKK